MASLGTCGKHLVSRSLEPVVRRRGTHDVKLMEISLDQRGLEMFMVEELLPAPFKEEILVDLKV